MRKSKPFLGCAWVSNFRALNVPPPWTPGTWFVAIWVENLIKNPCLHLSIGYIKLYCNTVFFLYSVGWYRPRGCDTMTGVKNKAWDHLRTPTRRGVIFVVTLSLSPLVEVIRGRILWTSELFSDFKRNHNPSQLKTHNTDVRSVECATNELIGSECTAKEMNEPVTECWMTLDVRKERVREREGEQERGFHQDTFWFSCPKWIFWTM